MNLPVDYIHSWIFTARNEVGARLCFYKCVWFCSKAGVGVGSAIPTCIAGGIPACLTPGLHGVVLSQHALQEKGLISKLEITCLLIIIISLNFFWIKYLFHFRILVSNLWSSQADIANSYLRNLIDTTVKTVMEIFS